MDFDRWMKEGSRNGASLCEGFNEGTFRETSFTGEPERYIKQGSEMGVSFHGGSTFEEHSWTFLLGAFLLEEFF